MLTPLLAVCAAAAAGAGGAFLVFNRPPATAFLGDIGSLALGYTHSALVLLSPEARRPKAVLLVAVGLFVFLADPALCLVARVVRGERWYDARREHLDQRWASGRRRWEWSGQWF